MQLPHPSRTARGAAAACVAAAVLCGCTESARLPSEAGFGPMPQLPAPNHTAIPTVHVAPARGWADGARPVAGDGMAVNAFADKLDHPRWLYVLPNGDVLVAETNAPPKPDDGKGIRGWIMNKLMARAGAAAPSANRITLLRDTNGDGVADQRSVFLKDLHSPFGMVLVGNDFYVADTDAVLRFPYQPGQTSITAAGQKVVDLPAGTLNHHWTKNIIASRDGSKLYVTVGSNSNVGENGIDKEAGRAAIWEVDRKTGQHRIFASGLRNPNGMAWEPVTGVLWTAVNERDEIGSDLVPDYITSVRNGGFYGWPYSYYGQHVDERIKPQAPDLVAKAIAPDYAVGAHTASLGLAAAGGNSLPARFHDGMFVGQHGSWNRKPFAGYKVIFVPFDNGRPKGAPFDVLTGFLSKDGEAQGRPVGVVIDKRGSLLVADDVGNTIWRVSGAK
ncbi:PQQ-dependent sugar dehydrogenase [Cupriavidus sp. IDO]|uniref:PQQ-dependent sugar dehydrogenase n=1 Tax=Cupriavidus sp. IDO TaxID=1539142 RepID=UPI0009E22C7F|nr:sorbosone dehydrogenase family protein [Cupriavidus sp. IDO]